LEDSDRTKDMIKQIKRSYAKSLGSAQLPTNIQLLQTYHYMLQQEVIERDREIEQLLIKRPIRSQSGIVSVQVLTKPYRCPGKCIFCPNDFTMPKSYINTEPGAMRALLNNFDPYKQVYNRLLSLTLTGHPTDKIEMIVLGGTRDVYTEEYKEWFIKGLYDACNQFPQFFKQLDLSAYRKQSDSKYIGYKVEEMEFDYADDIHTSIDTNEDADNKIIGLTIETRPEYVTDTNCRLRRTRGITRLEMGVQSTDDEVLDANKRGHHTHQVRAALHKLRQYAFKFSIHIMPGLYQSTLAKDLQSFVDIFSDPSIKPDEMKFYPTAVIPNTELYELYRSGDYTPMEIDDIQTLIRQVLLEYVPPYNRIKRLIRDIPSSEIAAGSDVTNLSQLTHQAIADELAEDITGRTKLYTRLYE
jgi:elongator complex protein 3